MEGTNRMFANLDPRRSLETCFTDYFYPALDTTEAFLRPKLEDFYRHVFPTLKSRTRVRPEAAPFLEQAMNRGMEIVVATNPLFPRIAVEERLDWADVPSGKINFTDITTYECYHFTKPRLEYYAEILGRLGRLPHEAVMIGNDVEDDLAPARLLGIAVFHIREKPEDTYPGGSLTDAGNWLDQAHQETSREAVRSPSALQARLRANVAAMTTLTQDLDHDLWYRQPAKAEWSPAEILCHLRDVEVEVTQPRFDLILSESEPFVSAVDVDPWAEERNYSDQSGSDALQTLIEARLALLEKMQDLESSAWERPARHALLGPTTLAEVVSVAAEHEVLHLAQLRASIPACAQITSQGNLE
jgi:FMN phosphatase YigB (HAD superfamily)